MGPFEQYHPNDDTSRSLATLGIASLTSIVLLLVLDVPSSLNTTGESFTLDSWATLVLLWHLLCLSVCASAIVYMFRMKTGHMVVRSHELKKDVLIHPLGIHKFVTFSSWTLILTVVFFALATLASVLFLNDASLPTWLKQAMSAMFVTALGASFLTSTVVRFVILPGNHTDEEHHRRQFWFHNQVMHNFCTVFLVVEILITTPQLEWTYMFLGILIGLTYAIFALPFAFFGGGYYCYSFIDPRLQKGPLFIGLLAFAISFSYVGVWLVTKLISLYYIAGALLLILWAAQIVQFKPLNDVQSGRRDEPKIER